MVVYVVSDFYVLRLNTPEAAVRCQLKSAGKGRYAYGAVISTVLTLAFIIFI